jgi:hypothetical protein
MSAMSGNLHVRIVRFVVLALRMIDGADQLMMLAVVMTTTGDVDVACACRGCRTKLMATNMFCGLINGGVSKKINDK